MESLPQLAPESHGVLELVRDALELKKLNNNLMKITMFEDLIADLYARLYEMNIPHLAQQVTEENKEKMKVDHLLMVGDGSTETAASSTPAPTSETPAPRGRTKGIARRDIQKRADTIVNTKLAPRAVASKLAAAGETDPPATPHAPGSTPAPSTAARVSVKTATAGGDAAAGRRHGEDGGDDTESEAEDTKLDEGTSALFPHVTDAEDIGTGDEGADDGNEEEDDGEGEGEGEEGEGVTYVEGDEDEEMQDEETKLDEEDEKNFTADQSVNDNDTETELVNGKPNGEHDAMDITTADS
jgi:hypothetical protein